MEARLSRLLRKIAACYLLMLTEEGNRLRIARLMAFALIFGSCVATQRIQNRTCHQEVELFVLQTPAPYFYSKLSLKDRFYILEMCSRTDFNQIGYLTEIHMRREKCITFTFYFLCYVSVIAFVWREWGGVYACMGLVFGALLGWLPIFSAILLSILVISAWFEGRIFYSNPEFFKFLYFISPVIILYTILFAATRVWFYRKINLNLSKMNWLQRQLLRFANISTKPGKFFLTGQHNTDIRHEKNGFYVVEMNDQGICFDPEAINLIVTEIEACLHIENCDVITFVHGWNHNASPEDSNLIAFKKILKDISKLRKGKKIIGIYVGWQGKKYRGIPQKTTTFYDRSRRTQTIAQGSLIELYQKLSELRSRASLKSKTDLCDMKLLHWGHSFGGAIVFTAFSQEILKSSLEINAPRSADKILVLNPAISGMSFLGTYIALSKSVSHNMNANIQSTSMVCIERDSFFVCLTSEGDINLNKDFKFAFRMKTLTESYYQPIERRCLFTPIGLVDEFQTHDANSNWLHSYGSQSIHIQITKKEFIKDHNDIWNAKIAEMIAYQLI